MNLRAAKRILTYSGVSLTAYVAFYDKLPRSMNFNSYEM